MRRLFLGKFKITLLAPTPENILLRAWWTLVFFLLFSLIADGLIFYRYGLVAAPATGGVREVTKLNIPLIEDAARHVIERKAKLQRILSVSSDLPDVFLPSPEPPAVGSSVFNAESEQ